MKALFKLLLLFIFIAASLSASLYLGLGLMVSSYASAPHKADVIVVLGGDEGLRVRRGGELFKAGYAKHIILTGIDSKYYRPNHPNWRERKLMSFGVPRNAIFVDTWSESTWEEAENASETMDKNGWKSAIVVSDPPHMLRLHKSWSKAFEGTSKRFTLVSTKPGWWNALFWWQNRTSQQFVISEVKKNLFYSVMYY
ncbi:MAG: YdcF family protein [Chlorobiaceae bacterium]|nr:YdcF family protein [Chlorobiaceae bacterium]NTW74801.1 YdcF family protein [Chlorobiaceae bacterium]